MHTPFKLQFITLFYFILSHGARVHRINYLIGQLFISSGHVPNGTNGLTDKNVKNISLQYCNFHVNLTI